MRGAENQSIKKREKERATNGPSKLWVRMFRGKGEKPRPGADLELDSWRITLQENPFCLRREGGSTEKVRQAFCPQRTVLNRCRPGPTRRQK